MKIAQTPKDNHAFSASWLLVATSSEHFASISRRVRILMPSGGHLGVILKPLWGHLGATLGPAWATLGPPWVHLGAMLEHLGPSWGRLGPSCGHHGPFWDVLGPSWAISGEGSSFDNRSNTSRKCAFSASWGFVETSYEHLASISRRVRILMPSGGHLGAILGSSWSHPGAISVPCWGHLGPDFRGVRGEEVVLSNAKQRQAALSKAMLS